MAVSPFKAFHLVVMVKKAAAPTHEDALAEETKKLVVEKGVTAKDISTFLSTHINDYSCLPEFAHLLRRSPCTIQLSKSVSSAVFQLAREGTALWPWCEALIHCMNAEILWPHRPIHEALFFPSDENEYKILHYVQQAKVYINLCVFALSNDLLVDALVQKHKSGVQVRVISDDEQAERSGADMERIREAGIQGKLDQSKANMHHKFCVVDGTVLIMGSFNWTRQAVEKNQENLIITDDTVLIQAYNGEFEKLWAAFAVTLGSAPRSNLDASVQKLVDMLVSIFHRAETESKQT